MIVRFKQKGALIIISTPVMVVVVLASYIVRPFPVVATDSFSANFISRDPIMSDFGGRATSTGFEQINAGGQTVIGEATSTNFIIRSGWLYFEERIFTPKSQNWRWYDDETNETPTASLAAENTAPANVDNQNIIKLRLTIKDVGNATSTNTKFKLQFSESADFSLDVNDVVEIGNCLSNSLWCYAAGAGADNAVIAIGVLSDSAVCSGGSGAGCGTHNISGVSTSTFTARATAPVEYEFTIKSAGARVNATYFFRAWDARRNQPVPANTGKTFPSLSTAGAGLTFIIVGLPAATTTEGVVTTVPTTPTSIAFDNLNFDTEYAAAQRLIVTANATQGYQIFILEQQGLVGPSEIMPVEATNEAPLPWAIPPAAAGAFGYHAGDDVLAGNSPRFAPDNTYAKLETAAKEVAFRSGPATNRVTDVIFKTQVTNQQEAGSYQAAIAYVAVPIF